MSTDAVPAAIRKMHNYDALACISEAMMTELFRTMSREQV